jgi:hypothetical protein
MLIHHPKDSDQLSMGGEKEKIFFSSFGVFAAFDFN